LDEVQRWVAIESFGKRSIAGALVAETKPSFLTAGG
jgi:hypothetical protein